MIVTARRVLQIANKPHQHQTTTEALFTLFTIIIYVKYQNVRVKNYHSVDSSQ